MSDTAAAAPRLEGIGGWLVLPIAHILLNALVMAINVIDGFRIGYGGGDVAARDLMLGITWFELSLLAYSGFCLAMLFLKRRQTPYLMIGFYALLLVMVVAEFFLATHQLPNMTLNEKSEPLKAVVRTAIAAAVWIPYFLVSKRVKNTFVR